MKKSVECPKCGCPVAIFQNPIPTVDVIIESPQGILLIKRGNPPFGWALPGGFVDYGESAEDAVVRETREETGLEISEIRQFHCYSEPYRDPRHHTITVIFTARAVGEPYASDDAQEVHFFPWDSLPDDMAFDHRQILEDYRNQRWQSR